MGMLDLLADTQLDNEQRDYVQSARSSAESLLQIINDILDFSKLKREALYRANLGCDPFAGGRCRAVLARSAPQVCRGCGLRGCGGP